MRRETCAESGMHRFEFETVKISQSTNRITKSVAIFNARYPCAYTLLDATRSTGYGWNPSLQQSFWLDAYDRPLGTYVKLSRVLCIIQVLCLICEGDFGFGSHCAMSLLISSVTVHLSRLCCGVNVVRGRCFTNGYLSCLGGGFSKRNFVLCRRINSKRSPYVKLNTHCTIFAKSLVQSAFI